MDELTPSPYYLFVPSGQILVLWQVRELYPNISIPPEIDFPAPNVRLIYATTKPEPSRPNVAVVMDSPNYNSEEDRYYQAWKELDLEELDNAST